MKRLTTLVMVLICTALSAQAQFNGGSGTEEDPYLIRRPAQLANLSTILNQSEVFVKLQSDIDLTGYLEDEGLATEGWLPIGNNTTPFKGTIIGNGKKIRGLFINRSSETNIGLFGFLDGANISNLAIEATVITGSSYLGALAGYAKNCSLNNCQITITNGISSTSGEYVGGFLGMAYNCNITNCSVAGSISSTGANFVGGLCGGATDGTQVSNIITAITLNNEGDCTGGLFGITKTVTVTNSQVEGDISGISNVGGVIGKAEGTDVLNDVKCVGNVAGQAVVSGISAYLASGSSSFTFCSFKGRITATGDYAGGIVGRSMGVYIAEMTNCSNFGDIIANSNVGGLIGAITPSPTSVPQLYSYTIRITRTSGKIETQNLASDVWDKTTLTSNHIKNNMVSGIITGNNNIGGLVGYDISSTIYPSQQCWTETSGSYPSNYAKKIELLKNGVVIGTYSPSSKIKVYWYKYSRNSTSLSLTNNYCIGEVKGKSNVGGLVGYKSGGEVSRNYTFVSISGEDNVGGLIGHHAVGNDAVASKTTMTSNVAINSTVVSNTTNSGRIYGFTDNTNYIVIPELDSNTSNRSLETTRMIVNGINQEVNEDLHNGISSSLSELRSKSNYQTWGWDFESDWNIIDETSFPYKKYQAAPPFIETGLASKSTTLSGVSANGGTVVLKYNNHIPKTISCDECNWTTDIEPLQSGATLTIYAVADGLVASYPYRYLIGPEGAGTKEEPYRLYTADDLQGISKSGYYKLMNSIDLAPWIINNNSTEGWIPIGQKGIENVHLDGNGYMIKGLWAHTTGMYNGLFASFPNGGSLKDLTIEVATGKKLQGGNFVGILAGYTSGLTIENCQVNGNVESSSYAGGLIGYAESGSISTSCSKGNVKAIGESGYAGGLVAYCSTPIANSYSSANVEASECVAGLVGFSSSVIDKCYARGTITGGHYGAGIVALLSGETAAVTNSVALNETITMSDELASASRVINSNINGCPDPDHSNLALKTTLLTLNGKTENIYDDEWEGTGRIFDELLSSATYKALGWNFASIWGIIENDTPPYLFYEMKQGDMNRDGQIDMTDAVSIVYYYLGERPKVFVEETADINGDGRIDITDAIIIVYQYLGENGNSANARKLIEEAIGNEPQ